jgi:hypothetical protein
MTHTAVYFYNETKALSNLRYQDFCADLVIREEFSREYLQKAVTIFPTDEDEDAGADIAELYENEDLARRYHAVAVLFLQKFGFRVTDVTNGAFEDFTNTCYERFLKLLDNSYHDKFLRTLLRSLSTMGFAYYVKTIYNMFVCAYQRTGKVTQAAIEWSKNISSDLARMLIRFHTPDAKHSLSRVSAAITEAPAAVPRFAFKHPRRNDMIEQCEHGVLPRLKSSPTGRTYKCLLHIVITAGEAACDIEIDS